MTAPPLPPLGGTGLTWGGDYKGGTGTCCWWACKLALSLVHLLERRKARKILQLCLFVHLVGLVVQPLPLASADLDVCGVDAVGNRVAWTAI